MCFENFVFCGERLLALTQIVVGLTSIDVSRDPYPTILIFFSPSVVAGGDT